MEHEAILDKLAKEQEIARIREASEKKAKTAEKELQAIIDEIHRAQLARAESDVESYENKVSTENALIKSRQDAAAEAITTIFNSISPDLIAVMRNSSNAELLETLTKNMSPIAIAKNESVVDATTRLLRGTELDSILGNILTSISKNIDNEEVKEFVNDIDDEY